MWFMPPGWRGAWDLSVNGELKHLHGFSFAADAVIKVIDKKCQGDADDHGDFEEGEERSGPATWAGSEAALTTFADARGWVPDCENVGVLRTS